MEDHLPELAHHYSRSGNVVKAVEYLGRVGQRAAQQAAYAEADGYLTRALELLPQLPESVDRDRQELGLRQSLVDVLWVTKGYGAPEARTAVERVAALAERSGTLTALVFAVHRRWGAAFSASDYPAFGLLADQLLDLAVREGSPDSLALAHIAQLQTRYLLGDLAGAEEHFTAGLVFFDALRRLPGFAPSQCVHGSWTAWSRGYVDVARARMAQAEAAADPSNAFELTWAEWGAASFRLLVGEYAAAEALAAQALVRAETHQFPAVVALSQVALGDARARLGRAREGVALIREGIVGLLDIGFRSGLPYALYALAGAQAGAGALAEALAAVEQALQVNPEGLVRVPDNLRLRGELRHTEGQTELAQADFREAIALSRRMGAKMLELRATMSLARLLAEQGQRDEARTMLAEIYGWFTEGFDTADLQETKALLDELGG